MRVPAHWLWLLVVPIASGSDLSEAAKQAKAAQTQPVKHTFSIVGKPGRSLRPGDPGALAAEPDAPPPPEVQAGSGGAGAKMGAALSARADSMRREIERLQKDVDELSTVNGRHVEYQAKKMRLDRLKSELETMEEEARKRNIPPGYLR